MGTSDAAACFTGVSSANSGHGKFAAKKAIEYCKFAFLPCFYYGETLASEIYDGCSYLNIETFIKQIYHNDE